MIARCSDRTFGYGFKAYCAGVAETTSITCTSDCLGLLFDGSTASIRWHKAFMRMNAVVIVKLVKIWVVITAR